MSQISARITERRRAVLFCVFETLSLVEESGSKDEMEWEILPLTLYYLKARGMEGLGTEYYPDRATEYTGLAETFAEAEVLTILKWETPYNGTYLFNPDRTALIGSVLEARGFFRPNEWTRVQQACQYAVEEFRKRLRQLRLAEPEPITRGPLRLLTS